MHVIPIKRIITQSTFEKEKLPHQISNEPIMRLNKAQNTFSKGDDKPFPRGFAKGVGNLSPETP
jgi:hypothetical protein